MPLKMNQCKKLKIITNRPLDRPAYQLDDL